jgi:N-methylhydantoinase A
MLHTDLRYELARSALTPTGMPADDALRRLFNTLEQDGRARMAGWFNGPLVAKRSADMRYGEQVFEIAVPLDGLDWTAPGLGDRIRSAFHARHRALFTYDLPEEEVVLVNARLAVIGALPRGGPARHAAVAAAAPMTRRITLGGNALNAPVHHFETLVPGTILAGPAVAESATTTVLLQPGDTARMDARGWLELTIPPG